MSSRLLCTFFSQYRGRPLTEHMVTGILSFLRTIPIDPSEIPPSVYHLKKAAHAFAPEISIEALTTPTGTIYHYPLRNVLGMLLANKSSTHDWRFTYNGDDSHSCSTEAWRTTEESVKDLLPTRKLLLISLFVDKYQYVFFWSN